MWCLKPHNQQSEKLYQPSEGSALNHLWLPDNPWTFRIFSLEQKCDSKSFIGRKHIKPYSDIEDWAPSFFVSVGIMFTKFGFHICTGPAVSCPVSCGLFMAKLYYDHTQESTFMHMAVRKSICAYDAMTHNLFLPNILSYKHHLLPLNSE